MLTQELRLNYLAQSISRVTIGRLHVAYEGRQMGSGPAYDLANVGPRHIDFKRGGHRRAHLGNALGGKHVRLLHMGGAVVRVPDDAVAFGNRGSDFCFNIVGVWDDPQLARTRSGRLIRLPA